MEVELDFAARTLIDHEYVKSKFAPVYNPASFARKIGFTAESSVEDAARAVVSAHEAGPGWSALSTQQRSEMVMTVVPEWDASLSKRAKTLTREQGKVLWESVADSRGPKLVSDYFARTAPSVLEPVHVEDPGGITVTRHVPYGVTVVIVPWNYPVYLAFQHIAPALITGNTVVVKPSEFAPLGLTMALDSLAHRLPKGVLNIVPGNGQEVGPVLTSHPLVRKVLFTGSTAVGKSILHSAADSVKSVGLELGGNDPAIILPGSHLDDESFRELVRGVFTCSGQICFSIKRIYVHQKDLKGFLEGFMAAVNEISVGDGMNPESTIGPVNNRKEFERLQGLFHRVSESGARVHTLGSAVDQATWDDGYFIKPMVVTEIDPGHELVQTEQFGPIIPIVPYTDVSNVIQEANKSEYGLCASVWADDVNHALTVGKDLAAGTVFVNAHRMGISDMTMPFGGVKQSGLGRTHGVEALLECTEPQVLAYRTDLSGLPGPDLTGLLQP